MINFKNAFILARTKLKTRKIRLIVTIIISGLMFGVLAISIFFFTGFFNTIDKFNQEGLNNRFVMQVYQDYDRGFDKYAKSEAGKKQIQIFIDQEINIRAQRGKELGLDISKQQLKESLEAKKDTLYFDRDDIIALKMEKHYHQHVRSPKAIQSLDQIKELAKGYNPIGFYTLNDYDASSNIQLLDKNGQYSIPKDQEQNGKSNSNHLFFNTIKSMPTKLVQDYLFDDYQKTLKPDSIPIIVSMEVAEEVLNLKPIPEKASTKEIISRMEELKQKTQGHIIKSCFRNQTALAQIESAKQYQINKNKKDYFIPSVIYDLPADGECATATISKDSRTAEEKKQEQSQKIYAQEFENVPSEIAIAKEMSFQIIGLTPYLELQASERGSLVSLLTNFVRSNLEYSVVALSDFEGHNLDAQLANMYTMSKKDSSVPTFFIEFAKIEDYKKFAEDKSCHQARIEQDFEYWQDFICPAERPLSIMPFGNQRVRLESAFDIFNKVLKYCLIFAIGMATIIMSGTVGRLIADSRRETAVFRAIGFKRSDIVIVYSLYTLIVCLMIAVFVIIFGATITLLIDAKINSQATNQLLLLTGGLNSALKASFFGISVLNLGKLIGAIIVVGLVGITIPLLRNIRRNPIKDMRDE